jgi:anti-sigma factor RsiW
MASLEHWLAACRQAASRTAALEAQSRALVQAATALVLETRARRHRLVAGSRDEDKVDGAPMKVEPWALLVPQPRKI